MKCIFILLILTMAATFVHAQDIAGDWQGTLNTGMGELRLVLHLTKGADGALKGTLDSIDQPGANGIPINSITLKDSKLNLDVTAVHGTYEGKVAADGKTISGTWSQGQSLALDFKRATAPIKTEHKPAKPSDIDGTWAGTLDTGISKLRVVFHISNTEDGLIATMDSPDQNMKGLPTTSVTRDGSSLKVEVKAIGGVYSGKLSADLSSIDGTWSQGGADLPLVLKRTKDQAEVEHKPVKPSDIDGAWLGTLDTGTMKLRVVFHIVNTDEGLSATLDSLDQGLKGMSTSSVTRDGPALKIEVKNVGGVFEGKIAPDLSSIDGTWTQGSAMPLVLKPVKNLAELEPKRPQNPARPYPYHEEEVTYENKTQNVTLAATLTIPQGKGPFPGVLLITGSGPQDRDETLLGHRPFLILSDYLTRHGIAVLRADDRGMGKSTGVFSKATTADFATDAEAGVAYLKTRAEIDPHKIGLVGHSEGAMIAPMVAARNQDVAFIVMMAGTAVPGDQVIVAQMEAIDVANGKKPEDAARSAAKQREVMRLIETEKDQAVLEKELRETMSGAGTEAQIGMEIRQFTSVWFRYFLTYDPATALRQVTCPVLAINGSLDKQVLPDQNLPVIRKALKEGGNKHFEVDELPGLNHLFQTAKTGSPAEYAQIEETMSPVALEKMSTWILKQ
ncbi:MAG TPA: alpha/beta fold hydrolase [Candidatus Dormibacteraeota bacterium]|nr:alpha/beta fold hydrolase [Candidatus Dormibacteraeota bacterium]